MGLYDNGCECATCRAKRAMNTLREFGINPDASEERE